MNMSVRRALLGSAAVCGLLAGTTTAGATIASHNGTVNSIPAGSGAVNVFLSCGSEAQLDICTKDFLAVATHSMVVTSATSFTTLKETIINDSGVAWTDFHFT